MLTYSAIAMRAVATVTFVVVAGACGSQGDGQPSAQPTPNVTTFETGRFDDLPRFPRSEPLGPRNEKDGVVARSFMARGTTPEGILEYYQRSLGDQWSLMHEFEKLGAGTYRADWTNGEQRLRVSATREPTLDVNNASAEVTVQYSLTLNPVGG